jgi:ubiquinone biosynthesis protein
MLLKALVMTEGVGLQIDPNLDIFKIARPYAQKAFARQLTPEAVRERVVARGRSLAEAALTLPLQISDLLQQLQEGELRIQTQEQELQRLAKALNKAANQLALALVLGAMILGLGMLSIAIGLGHWQGTIPSILGIGGLLITLFIALLLAFGLMRSGDN